MRDVIERELRRIEQDDSVRVVYAVESGSRAWGFQSADSDWDVRFLYLRRPEWYLSIKAGRDVLEYPVADGLDFSGWDLPKALRLFAKSNPPLLEWLRSPIVYAQWGGAVPRMKELSARYFSPSSCLHHYLHMAEGNFRVYLQGERVRLKKYFYVLRPVLACQWIESRQSMPPMEFETLAGSEVGDDRVQARIADLLKRKRGGEELDDGPRVEELHAFVEERIAHFRKLVGTLPRRPSPDLGDLDSLFRDALREAWS